VQKVFPYDLKLSHSAFVTDEWTDEQTTTRTKSLTVTEVRLVKKKLLSRANSTSWRWSLLFFCVTCHVILH